ncbi:hypothetical protein CYMTET_22838 [Cymbomonas tetramitiformis]|uniref:Rhodanese domain-containing protein n=1 Tax=Cymbomonas tetramitiformis TaxID=36881 RepID=A0AAE0L1T5_9CHLO|nr:hypothetical protein CYMTET_22838 [Cymbomonas tetramitiformis]
MFSVTQLGRSPSVGLRFRQTPGLGFDQTPGQSALRSRARHPKAWFPSRSVRHGRPLLQVVRSDETYQPQEGVLEKTWNQMCVKLLDDRKEGMLKKFQPDEAYRKWEDEEYVLIDVRTEDDFKEVHAIGSVCIPVFTPIEGDSFFKKQKRLANFFMGNTKATEANPIFIEEVFVQLDENKSQPVIILCRNGGSLPTEKMKEGVRSRSLIAAFKLLDAGFTKVYFVEGGLQKWGQAGFPTTLTHDEIF